MAARLRGWRRRSSSPSLPRVSNGILSLKDKHLTKVPREVRNATDVDEIDLRGNCLPTLGEKPWKCASTLKKLHLSGNRLRSLPDFAFQFVSLILLDLEGNPNLQGVPPAVFYMENLLELRLPVVEHATLRGLIALKNLSTLSFALRRERANGEDSIDRFFRYTGHRRICTALATEEYNLAGARGGDFGIRPVRVRSPRHH